MKPAILQKLKHDKLLTKGNFPTFVETFNYTVNRTNNIVGDKDLDPQNGAIRVDNTDPEHPVIRLDKPIVEVQSQGGEGDNTPRPFQYVLREETVNGNDVEIHEVVNNAFYWDGQYHTLSNYSVQSATCTIYLVGTKTGSGEGSWSFAIAESISSSQVNVHGYKLYDLVDWQVTMDYRDTSLTYAPQRRDYFKVRTESQSGGQVIELDATSSTTPTVTLQASGAEDPAISLAGGNQPQIMMNDVDGAQTTYEPDSLQMTDSQGAAHCLIEPNMFYAQGDDSDEVTLAANGGSHSVTITTSGATQGDVSLQECQYYEQGQQSPTTVNVLASSSMTLGGPPPNLSVVTDVSFSWSGYNLIMTKTKQNLRTGQQSTSTSTIITLTDVTLVSDVEYVNPTCTQTKKTISTIGGASATTSSQVFTTTPLSSE